jgi:hypothetical protein
MRFPTLKTRGGRKGLLGAVLLAALLIAVGIGINAAYYDGDFYNVLVKGSMATRSGAVIDFTGATLKTTPTIATHNYGATATDWTIPTADTYAGYITVSNASGGVNALLRSAVAGHTYTVFNGSGQVLTFKVTGKTGGTIANGKRAFYTATTADVFEVWEQS